MLNSLHLSGNVFISEKILRNFYISSYFYTYQSTKLVLVIAIDLIVAHLLVVQSRVAVSNLLVYEN
jgi:hypothetical protein